MVDRMGGLLDEARLRSFVGRAEERASFDRALSGISQQRVVFVYGPGGIGKTSLLRQLGRQAANAGRPVIAIDGREPDIDAEAIRCATLGAAEMPQVVLLDSYDQLSGLDRWVREQWLPGLCADSVVVLAGRQPPPAEWRVDPGWRTLVAEHRLELLDDTESAELLVRSGVDADAVAHLVDVGDGHPLTLGLLAAAARHRVPKGLGDAPDIVSSVLPIILDDVPDEDHALGLDLCAMAWLLTKPMLAESVGARSDEVWTWLADQPFISQSADGLYAHDLVRDVLEAHLSRVRPDQHQRLFSLARLHARREVARTSGQQRLRAATQLCWLHRRGTLVGAAVTKLLDDSSVRVAVARSGEHTEILDLVERVDGPEEAAALERWLWARPEGLLTMRRGDRLTAWFHTVSWLHESGRAGTGVNDPVTDQIAEAIARLGPLRERETVAVARAGGGPEHQSGDDFATLCGIGVIIEWLTQSFAWAWNVTKEPELFGPSFEYMGFDQRVEFDDGRIAFGIDWRRYGFDVWYDEVGRRARNGERGPLDPALLRPLPIDRPRFDDAVRALLRSLDPEPGAAQRVVPSPLEATVLVRDPDRDASEQLRSFAHWAIDTLTASPSTVELGRVLDRTFRRGAPTQEAAAEVLGLPFSTYRRRLGTAIERMTDLLWSVEIGQLSVDDLDIDGDLERKGRPGT